LRLRTVLICLFFALMITYACVNCYFHTFRNFNAGTLGWAVTDNKKIRLELNDPNNSLKDGDELVSINSIPYQSLRQYWRDYEAQHPPETIYDITIRRDGQLKDFKLSYQKQTFSTLFLNLLIWLFIPAVFIATGITVFFLRTDDKQALLLAILFCMFAALSQATERVD